jgi:acetyltransferase-like isoleucine patch superfamily enzyme
LREGTTFGAFCHLLSGGEYDSADKTPFCERRRIKTRGELVIGRNCWLGASVTVLDGACIGGHCVIGAHSLVRHPIPADSLAYGTPAKVVKNI